VGAEELCDGEAHREWVGIRANEGLGLTRDGVMWGKSMSSLIES